MIASRDLCVVERQTKVSHRALRGFRRSTGRVENPQKIRLSESQALDDYVMLSCDTTTSHHYVIQMNTFSGDLVNRCTLLALGHFDFNVDEVLFDCITDMYLLHAIFMLMLEHMRGILK